jgi:hypothetical protein
LCPGPKSGSALSTRVAGSPGFVLESGILEKERKQQGSVIGTNKKPQQMIETNKLYILLQINCYAAYLYQPIYGYAMFCFCVVNLK